MNKKQKVITLDEITRKGLFKRIKEFEEEYAKKNCKGEKHKDCFDYGNGIKKCLKVEQAIRKKFGKEIKNYFLEVFSST